MISASEKLKEFILFALYERSGKIDFKLIDAMSWSEGLVEKVNLLDVLTDGTTDGLWIPEEGGDTYVLTKTGYTKAKWIYSVRGGVYSA